MARRSRTRGPSSNTTSYYAKNYTPFLDLLILLQTLRVVLWHEGAR